MQACTHTKKKNPQHQNPLSTPKAQYTMNNSESADIHAARHPTQTTHSRTGQRAHRTEASRSGSGNRTGGGAGASCWRAAAAAGESIGGAFGSAMPGPPSPRPRRGTLGERAERGGGGGGVVVYSSPGNAGIYRRTRQIGGRRRETWEGGEKRSRAEAGGGTREGGRALNQFPRVYKSRGTPLRRSLTSGPGVPFVRALSLTSGATRRQLSPGSTEAYPDTWRRGRAGRDGRDGTREANARVLCRDANTFPLVPSIRCLCELDETMMHVDAMAVSPEMRNQSVKRMVPEGTPCCTKTRIQCRSKQASAHRTSDPPRRDTR